MKASIFSKISAVFLILAVTLPAWAHSDTDQKQSENSTAQTKKKPKRSPGGDIGSGAGNVGTGAARGAGNLAVGTAKGAGDVVTLHPIAGAEAIGGGAAKAGENVTVGAAKGTGKITRGIGRAFKKIF